MSKKNKKSNLWKYVLGFVGLIIFVLGLIIAVKLKDLIELFLVWVLSMFGVTGDINIAVWIIIVCIVLIVALLMAFGGIKLGKAIDKVIDNFQRKF